MNSHIVISSIKLNFVRARLVVEDCTDQWTNTGLFPPKKQFPKNKFKDGLLRTSV